VFPDKESKHRQQGFTLLEVMLALLVFMIVSLGIAQGQIGALETQSGNLMRDEALRLAEDELGRLKGLQFTLGGTAGALTATAAWTAPVNLSVNMRGTLVTFARSTRITDIAVNPIGLKQIDVAVGWTQSNTAVVFAETGLNHQTSLSTIIVQR
jgi:prepilin-type N-terminal cleavage/methylation domain-containing protein